jgi:two-component SAPR family response regulator
MNILILDDDDLILRMLGKCIELSMPESKVFKSQTAIQALDFLEKEKIDILLLDGHIYNGCKVGMQAMSMDIRTIICTGDSMFKDMKFNEVIFKPFLLDEFEHLLRNKPQP